MGEGQKRMAVLAGCNYPKLPKEYQLSGCINDALAMKLLLIDRFDFKETDIKFLIDAPVPGDDSSHEMPTRDNIIKALEQMIDQAKAGDVLLFYFAGHGTRPDPDKCDELSSIHEAIAPCDLKLIGDTELGAIVSRVREGVSFTFISDSCHSGGLMDNEKEQIGPSRITVGASAAAEGAKHRFIPYETVVQQLSINMPSNGDTHFAALAEANPDIWNIDTQQSSRCSDHGILLSACQANESAAEKEIVNDTVYGLFTYAIFVQLLNKEDDENSMISNRKLVLSATEIISEFISKYISKHPDKPIPQQHPCLYCDDQLADACFLKPIDLKLT